jgi:lambda family phage minor tail protein L
MGIRTETDNLDPKQIVTLFAVDGTALGAPQILRFTPAGSPADLPIKWGGQEYTPYPVVASGFEKNATGTLPRPTFQFSNITGQLGNFVAAYNGMIGAMVYRTRTFAKYLDGQPGADTTKTLGTDIWVCARKSQENAISITFECATMFDLEGIHLPLRQVLAGLCMYIYRGTECGYAGPPVQDINGNPTSDPNLDRCMKTLTACQARFGSKGPLPTSAFPASLLQSQPTS